MTSDSTLTIQVSGPSDLTINVVRSRESETWVRVRNESQADTLHQLVIEMQTVAHQAPFSIDSILLPGQSVVRRGTVDTRKDFVVHVTYLRAGIRNEQVVGVPSFKAGNQDLMTIMPAVISLVGVLVGAWLLHHFTSRREKNRTIVEWNRVLLERYEPAYRDFLQGWGGAESEMLLNSHFQVLLRNSVPPPGSVALYDKCRAVLSDPAASASERKDACERLYNHINSWIFSPQQTGGAKA
jgi:hypothetical protein